VTLAASLIATDPRPTIIFAGNAGLRAKVTEMVGSEAPLRVADNVRPSADVESLHALQSELESLYLTNKISKLAGYGSVEQWINVPALSTARAIGHVVQYMSLDDPRMPTLQGAYKVPHFDAKGEADAYFRDAGVPTTFLLTSFYWDNLIHFGMGPKPTGDGRLAFTMPMADKKLPGIAAEDIGKCAYGVFRKGAGTIGQTIGIAGEHLTGAQMAAALAKALGREVVYAAVTPEQYRAFGFPGAEDLGNMFQFKRDFEEYFCGARSVEVARALNPELQSFADWLAKNAARIPLA
jgi:hypothetical protein